MRRLILSHKDFQEIMLTALLLVTEDALGFITMMMMVKRANLVSCTDLRNYRKVKMTQQGFTFKVGPVLSSYERVTFLKRSWRERQKTNL